MTPTGPDFPAPPGGHDGGPYGPFRPSEFDGPVGPYGPYTSYGRGGRHRPYRPDDGDGTGRGGEVTGAGAILPRRGVVMHDAGRTRTARPGCPWPDGDLSEQALAALIRDGERISELLDLLSRGRLWLPLPSDGGPVTDGSAIQLPTVVYLGAEFVPAFTSAELLVSCARGSAADADCVREPGWSAASRRQDRQVGWVADRVPSTGDGSRRSVPHIVVPAAELARRLPAGLGIALNPGARVSVPIYPGGVTYLAAAEWEAGGARIRLSQPPAEPESLLSEISAGLRPITAARQASRAWLSVPGRGEGLIISVILDNPGDEASQAAVLAAVERAAAAAGPAERFPIDVTFPGEHEPDDIDRWIAGHAGPFHLR